MGNTEHPHIVTCIDILGYQEVLRRNDPEEIMRFETEFLYFVELNTPHESGVPSFRHISYTDNFLLYYKLDYDSNNRKRHNAIREIYGETIGSTKDRIERVLYLHIFGLALTQFDLIANNIVVRGGLTIGGFNVDGRIISGSGLIQAHDLEKKAVHPRIILEDSVVKEYITSSRPIPLLFDVEDRVIFIDFLSAKMRESMHLTYVYNIQEQRINTKSLDFFRLELKDVRDTILNALGSSSSNSVLDKYRWLAKYFDYFCYSYEFLKLNNLAIAPRKDKYGFENLK